MAQYTLLIPIRPVPKGSMNSPRVGKPFFYNYKEIKLETDLIRYEARRVGVKMSPSGWVVHCDFYFKRPKSHYTKSGKLCSSAPLRHTSKPDSDKLERTVLDALTGVAYKDDSYAYDTASRKHYSTENGIVIYLESDDD